ncbi:putative transcriptional regulatory protein TcrX [Microbacterium sp. 8M]|uniref:response regulator transcription factor n=1 Tax=Microbacterium sp. 8M TaxID=2653153 RepID=UPI0012F0ECAE|nr:response regulator transcription factor [Microbacterium sp. 8M]VXB49942.1 putative transcriptional regulatory protein TcrX [Microbacterium sp. 8M]
MEDHRPATALPLGLPPVVRADGSPARALVVDDEQALAAAVGESLRTDGWEVRVEHRGRSALIAVREFQPDVVVLDIMMPGIDGLDTLERIRAIRPEIRVLFLTALDGHDDRVAGLRAGGDDYLTKPFAIAELQARVRVLARTAAAIARPDDARLRVGDLAVDKAAATAQLGGNALELTPTEFELLLLLANNAGRVLRRAQILEAVWGYDFGTESNVVEVYVSSLRRKLAPSTALSLETVRLVGYVLRVADAAADAPATADPGGSGAAESVARDGSDLRESAAGGGA